MSLVIIAFITLMSIALTGLTPLSILLHARHWASSLRVLSHQSATVMPGGRDYGHPMQQLGKLMNR